MARDDEIFLDPLRGLGSIWLSYVTATRLRYRRGRLRQTLPQISFFRVFDYTSSLVLYYILL